MTTEEILEFALKEKGIELTLSQALLVQDFLESGAHVQLSRVYGKSTAAQVARAILRIKKG